MKMKTDDPLRGDRVKSLSVELEDGRVFTFTGAGSVNEYFPKLPQDGKLPAQWPVQHQMQAHLLVSQRYKISPPSDDAGEAIPESPSEPQATKGSDA